MVVHSALSRGGFGLGLVLPSSGPGIVVPCEVDLANFDNDTPKVLDGCSFSRGIVIIADYTMSVTTKYPYKSKVHVTSLDLRKPERNKFLSDILNSF